MVKQVSLSNEAYLRLKRQKKQSESFSDVILRVVKSPSGNLDRFIGAWKDENVSRIEAQILADRKASQSRNARF